MKPYQVLFCMFLSTTVFANDVVHVTAPKLLVACEEEIGAKLTGSCFAYIMGVLDTWANVRYHASELQRMSSGQFAPLAILGGLGLSCVPDSVTVREMRAVVTAHIKSHENAENLAASGMVVEAFRNAFPCSDGAPIFPSKSTEE